MKQKQKLLLILISIILIACGIFLPSLIWKAHMHHLTAKEELRAYDLTRTDAVLTPQMVLQNLLTFDMYKDAQSLSDDEIMQEIQTVYRSFTDFCDPDEQSYLNDLLAVAKLDEYNPTPVIRQGDHGAIYMVPVSVNLTCPDEKTQIFLSLSYESKTQMILSMEIISNREDVNIKGQDSLESAVRTYYRQLGIEEDQWQCFVNPDSFFFQLVTNDMQYGESEKIN